MIEKEVVRIRTAGGIGSAKDMLEENNRKILDHLLLPSTSMKGTWLRFMDKTRERRKIERFETFENALRLLRTWLNRSFAV